MSWHHLFIYYSDHIRLDLDRFQPLRTNEKRNPNFFNKKLARVWWFERDTRLNFKAKKLAKVLVA